MGDCVLVHHGILGMKWGIRRYRNKDGSLTSEGRKHYGSMSEKKLYKTLKKEFRNKRAELHGGANRWAVDEEVGVNGKKLQDEHEKNLKAYMSSKEYKKWEKAYDALDRKLSKDVEAGKIDIKDYDEAMNEQFRKRPKRNWNDLAFAKTLKDWGKWEYANDFVNKAGKNLSIARLKDLGYDEDVSKDFVERMARKGYTLGDI